MYWVRWEGESRCQEKYLRIDLEDNKKAITFAVPNKGYRGLRAFIEVL